MNEFFGKTYEYFSLFVLVRTKCFPDHTRFTRVSGSRILGLTNPNQQLEYYFQVFSEGEDAITRESKSFVHALL